MQTNSAGSHILIAMSDTPVPFLDLVDLHAPLKREFMAVFEQAVDGALFVGGPELPQFESEFAEYCGTTHAVGTSSGTSALRLAIKAAGFGHGDRIVTVANSFIATTESINEAAASFDLIDVDPETALMDPNRLEDWLKHRFDSGDRTMRPKAVVPVHLYGQCAEMDPINALAKKYDLMVFEDAAQAHGATYHGRPAGSLGDAASFSFYPGKNLGAFGEGGAVTTRDSKLAERVKMLRNHGQAEKYYHDIVGTNARLDGIQAAMLRIKLKHLDTWNDRRRAVAAMYDAAFEPLEWITPARVLPHNRSCYHLYVIHVADREALGAYLTEHGIGNMLHYPLPLHLQKAYAKFNYKAGDFPVAERLCRELISLPMHSQLNDEQVNRVIHVVRAFGG